jgi:hypothetical protein
MMVGAFDPAATGPVRSTPGDQEPHPDDIVDQLCALILGEPAEP